MNQVKLRLDIIRLLRIAATLWIIYLLILAIIDVAFLPAQPIPLRFYLVHSLSALLVLGLALWSRGRQRLGEMLVPLTIVLMSALPIITNHFLGRRLLPGPLTSAEGMALRILPMLILALILTAWCYRWAYVVLFSLGAGVLNLGLLLVRLGRSGPGFLPGVLVIIVETFSLLLIGYFISHLMDRLRAQQASLQQANTQLVHYAGTLENLTVSRERNRMARELHDTLAHTLSGLSLQLETVKAYWDVDPDTARLLLDRSLGATRRGLEETRRALKALRSEQLESLGLVLALRQMAESAAARARLRLDFKAPASLPALSPAVEQCLYRIAQEAMANVVHHAHAHHLKVHLTAEDAQITLLVQDDGQGFDSAQAAQEGHYGLAGMRERAALVGGNLQITGRAGTGATIQFTIEG